MPILVLWPIRIIDRQDIQSGLKNQCWYYLDWDSLSNDQREEIETILDEKRNQSVHKPIGFDETIVTVSHGLSKNNDWFHKFRNHFSEVPDNDVEAFTQKKESEGQSAFEIVTPSNLYIEDESGAPVSESEYAQLMTGNQHPISMSDPRTVTALGESPPKDISSWTIEKANTISQFLEIVRLIHSSDWYRSKNQITVAISENKENQLLEARFPNDKETMCVLAYFRQLHAKDKLLKSACDNYMEHCSNQRKIDWIRFQRDQFLKMIDSPPRFYRTVGETSRGVIKMFMYGAGLMHSSSDHGDDIKLHNFIKQHGVQKVVMIFNSSLRDIFSFAIAIYPVIEQDYTHWTRNMGLAEETRVSIPDLFKGFTSEPRERE